MHGYIDMYIDNLLWQHFPFVTSSGLNRHFQNFISSFICEN